MSTPRLTFLYPFLFAPRRQPAPFIREVSRTGRQVFRTAARKSQTARPVRYGKANEPPPYLGGTKGTASVRGDSIAPYDAKALPEPSAADMVQPAPKPQPKATDKSEVTVDDKSENPPRLLSSSVLNASESQPPGPPSPAPNTPSRHPLEAVLHMPPGDAQEKASPPDSEQNQGLQENTRPTDEAPDALKQAEANRPRPPHISAPEFVHHFDTYGLVKRLEDGGWTQAQAVTIMKATRLILSDNIDLAVNALVSKSNVENEAYLFQAACSELHTEIHTKRRTEFERSRAERTRLEHEVDILGQRMTQDSGNMKDELKGMFDDRKMSVQNEQRDIERKIQELNYKITISLNSDSRSDVEGVRWIITKRAISALAICVLMILGSLKFSSTAAAWAEEEKKRLAAMSPSRPYSSSSSGTQTSPHNEFVSDRAQGDMGQGEILVRQGDNPAFVSLG